MTIREATAADLDQIRVIFREYAALVGSAICFQSFERELSELPGAYASPGGTLLLAEEDDRVAGCVALRQLNPVTGEMKRLYVRPAFRGLGLGRLLVERVIAAARTRGYERLCLDTLPRLHEALAMYRRFGFRQIPAYGDNPPEAIC